MLIVQLNQTISDRNRCPISTVITLHINYMKLESLNSKDISNFLLISCTIVTKIYIYFQYCFKHIPTFKNLPYPYRHSKSVSTIMTPDLLWKMPPLYKYKSFRDGQITALSQIFLYFADHHLYNLFKCSILQIPIAMERTIFCS